MKIKQNILLKDYTTFKIGGQADYFCLARSQEDVQTAIGFAKEKNLEM